MTIVTITAPIYMQADELWSRVFGAEPWAMGSWWKQVTFADGCEWDKHGEVLVKLEDPESAASGLVTQKLNVTHLAAGLSDPAFPEHLRRQILDNNADCVSADALIQHVVYGEIVFG